MFYTTQYPVTFYQVNLMIEGTTLMSSPIYTEFTKFCEYVKTIRSFNNSDNFRIVEMIYNTPYYFTYQGVFNHYNINDTKFDVVESMENSQASNQDEDNIKTCSDIQKEDLNDAESNYGDGNIDFDRCYHGVSQSNQDTSLSSETRYSYENSLPDPIIDSSIVYSSYIDTSSKHNSQPSEYAIPEDAALYETNTVYDNVYFNTNTCYEQNTVDAVMEGNSDNMLSNEECDDNDEFSNNWEVIKEVCDNLLDSDEENDNEYSEFEIRKYGKGYMVTCPSSNEHYGEKYFHNGWWFPSSKGWFFKKEFYNDLISMGMVDVDKGQQFQDMCYEYYGDNILLLCYENHPNYRDAEYYGGKWDYKADGWIFPNNMEQYLIDNGAVYEFDEYNAFTNMTVKCLYRGRHTFLVTPPILSKYYGINTFRVSKYVGNWNDEMKGWIFNRAYENFFTKRGAHLV